MNWVNLVTTKWCVLLEQYAVTESAKVNICNKEWKLRGGRGEEERNRQEFFMRYDYLVLKHSKTLFYIFST